MPKSVNQKQKLLFLLDYLRQNTDETHTVTTPQIIDHLAANGIRAERKSIYNDIQTLCDYGGLHWSENIPHYTMLTFPLWKL